MKSIHSIQIHTNHPCTLYNFNYIYNIPICTNVLFV